MSGAAARAGDEACRHSHANERYSRDGGSPDSGSPPPLTKFANLLPAAVRLTMNASGQGGSTAAADVAAAAPSPARGTIAARDDDASETIAYGDELVGENNPWGGYFPIGCRDPSAAFSSLPVHTCVNDTTVEVATRTRGAGGGSSSSPTAAVEVSSSNYLNPFDFPDLRTSWSNFCGDRSGEPPLPRRKSGRGWPLEYVGDLKQGHGCIKSCAFPRDMSKQRGNEGEKSDSGVDYGKYGCAFGHKRGDIGDSNVIHGQSCNCGDSSCAARTKARQSQGGAELARCCVERACGACCGGQDARYFTADRRCTERCCPTEDKSDAPSTGRCALGTSPKSVLSISSNVTTPVEADYLNRNGVAPLFTQAANESSLDRTKTVVSELTAECTQTTRPLVHSTVRTDSEHMSAQENAVPARASRVIETLYGAAAGGGRDGGPESSHTNTNGSLRLACGLPKSDSQLEQQLLRQSVLNVGEASASSNSSNYSSRGSNPNPHITLCGTSAPQTPPRQAQLPSNKEDDLGASVRSVYSLLKSHVRPGEPQSSPLEPYTEKGRATGAADVDGSAESARGEDWEMYLSPLTIPLSDRTNALRYSSAGLSNHSAQSSIGAEMSDSMKDFAVDCGAGGGLGHQPTGRSLNPATGSNIVVTPLLQSVPPSFGGGISSGAKSSEGVPVDLLGNAVTSYPTNAEKWEVPQGSRECQRRISDWPLHVPATSQADYLAVHTALMHLQQKQQQLQQQQQQQKQHQMQTAYMAALSGLYSSLQQSQALMAGNSATPTGMYSADVIGAQRRQPLSTASLPPSGQGCASVGWSIDHGQMVPLVSSVECTSGGGGYPPAASQLPVSLAALYHAQHSGHYHHPPCQQTHHHHQLLSHVLPRGAGPSLDVADSSKAECGVRPNESIQQFSSLQDCGTAAAAGGDGFLAVNRPSGKGFLGGHVTTTPFSSPASAVMRGEAREDISPMILPFHGPGTAIMPLPQPFARQVLPSSFTGASASLEAPQQQQQQQRQSATHGTAGCAPQRVGNVHGTLHGQLRFIPYGCTVDRTPMGMGNTHVAKTMAPSSSAGASLPALASSGFLDRPAQTIPVFIQMFPSEFQDRAVMVLHRLFEATCGISTTPQKSTDGVSVATVTATEPRSSTSFIAMLKTNAVWTIIHRLRCRALLDRHGFWYAETMEQYLKLKEYCEYVRTLPQQQRHLRTDGLPCMPLVVELSHSVDIASICSPPSDPPFDELVPFRVFDRHRNRSRSRQPE